MIEMTIGGGKTLRDLRRTQAPVASQDAMMSERPTVSVLIGTRDRRAPLLRCLTSVMTQTYRDLEIVVLDDCSRHLDMREHVDRHVSDNRVRCFRAERQLGVAGGRNFLMTRARGDILLTLDDDAVFEDRRCVRRVVDALATHPEIGAVAFRVVTHQDGYDVPLVPFSRRRLRRDGTLISRRELVSYYQGAAYALRKATLATSGAYQDDFIFFDEELDLSYRLVKMGIAMLYCPDIVVHHYPGPPVLGREYNAERYYALRNKVWVAYKHLPFPYGMVYASVWTLYHGLAALRAGRPAVGVRALKDALAGLKHLERRPVDVRAVSYLKRHYGRLWY